MPPPLEDPMFPADCSTRQMLAHVMSKWGLLSIIALTDGPKRWSELLRMVEGISPKMLTQSLRPLIDYGFVTRKQMPTMPPHVEYSLTEDGREIADLLKPLIHALAVRAGDDIPRLLTQS